VLLQNHSAYDLADLASRAHRLFDTRGVVPHTASVTSL